MRAIIIFCISATMLCSCGGKLHKSFIKVSNSDFKFMKGLTDELDLRKGEYFNFRLVSTYKTVSRLDSTSLEKNAITIYEEVPVKTLTDASDSKIIFVDKIQEEFSDNYTQIGVDQICDNIVLWLGTEESTSESGPVLYMTTKRIFPVGLHNLRKDTRDLRKYEKKMYRIEYHRKLEKNYHLEFRKKRVEKRYKKFREKKESLTNEQVTGDRSYNKRSHLLRKMIADDQTLDLLQIDRFYVGQWYKIAGSDMIKICLKAEEDEGSEWFEIDAALVGQSSESLNLERITKITFERISNPVTDQLTVKSAVQSEKIELDKIVEILNPNESIGNITFRRIPEQRTMLSCGSKKDFRCNDPKLVKAAKSNITTARVYTKPNGKQTLVLSGTNAGEEVHFTLKHKKARQRLLNRKSLQSTFELKGTTLQKK